MKLVHPELEHQITFTENTIHVITIENRPFFAKLLEELLFQIEGNSGAFILSDDNTELEISKMCELIIDPFHLEFNNKKLLHKIYVALKEMTTDEFHYIETTELKSTIFKYIDRIVFNCDIPLTFADDFDISALFKALNIKIEDENTSLLEKLVNYISVFTDLTDISFFILVNLKQFFSYDDLRLFYQFVQYSKLTVLLFETTFTEQKHDCEQHYIIDTDLCEIY